MFAQDFNRNKNSKVKFRKWNNFQIKFSAQLGFVRTESTFPSKCIFKDKTNYLDTRRVIDAQGYFRITVKPVYYNNLWDLKNVVVMQIIKKISGK